MRRKDHRVELGKYVLLAGVLLTATTGFAGTVNYDTTGSTFFCNGVSGCVQNTPTSVTIGGLTFTYNSGSGSNVATPSIINLGNIVSTGTSGGVNVTGLLLSINVNATPPGGSGALPNGGISGTISTNNSGATILFSPNNRTTAFGMLPGVTISGGNQSFVYQILNPTLGLQAPTVGNPIGQTSIQGTVTDTSSLMTGNPGTTPQTTPVNTAFPNALSVTLKNSSSVVQSGVNVTFTAPASGASGTFSNNSNAITVASDLSGVATAVFTANGIAGGPYSVTASATNYPSVTFTLTNGSAPVAANMSSNPGTTPQSTTVNTAFANAPAVTVTDASNHPVAGANVIFTAPASGASGLFGNNATNITVQTDPSGVASAPFTANGIGGSYLVSASSQGVSNVSFALANLVVVSGQVQVTQSGFTRNHHTGYWVSILTVTNTSGVTINGPINVAMTAVTPGVTMVNNTGTYNGSPYITVTSGSIAPGVSIPVAILFNNPGNAFIAYTPVSLSGTI